LDFSTEGESVQNQGIRHFAPFYIAGTIAGAMGEIQAGA
jgi:hypothetical protein